MALVGDRANVYDDTLVALWRSADGADTVETFLGTADPGRGRAPRAGMAYIVNGGHRFVLDQHWGSGNPALRPRNHPTDPRAEWVRVWRDRNGTRHPELGEIVESGQAPILVHAGGSTEVIGGHSVGCLNVTGGWHGSPYRRFIALCRQHHAAAGVDLWRQHIATAVWDAEDFVLTARDGFDARSPTLRYGVQTAPDGWVGRMQARLGAVGHPGPVDGDFGPGTLRRLVAFQQAGALPTTGVCDATTYAALSPAAVA